jgi:hypothetical protein
MLFRSSAANFTDSAMPAVTLRKYGLPAAGLTALYLFDEPITAGQPNAGPYQDKSGNNNHAVKAGNRVAPTQQSYGLQVTDNDGFYIVCPFAQPDAYTVLGGVYADAQSGGNQEAHFSSCSANGPGTLAADSFAQSPYPTLSMAVASDSPIRAYSNPGDLSDSASQSVIQLSLSSGKRGQWIVPAMSINGATGNLKLTAKSGELVQVTTTKLVTRFSASDPANVYLGMMPFLGRRPSTGRLAAFAFYSRQLADDEMGVATAAIAKIMTDRGLTVV